MVLMVKKVKSLLIMNDLNVPYDSAIMTFQIYPVKFFEINTRSEFNRDDPNGPNALNDQHASSILNTIHE
jgi:hypothetical protein